jgi:hypothetical protein
MTWIDYFQVAVLGFAFSYAAVVYYCKREETDRLILAILLFLALVLTIIEG